MTFLGVTWFLFTIVADWLMKEWYLSEDRSNLILAMGLTLYIANALLWIEMLRKGLPMAKGSLIFSSLGLVAGILVGLVMGEDLKMVNWIGMGVALVAMLLVAI